MTLRHIQTLFPVTGLERRKAFLFEIQGHELSCVGIVFDDQNGLFRGIIYGWSLMGVIVVWTSLLLAEGRSRFEEKRVFNSVQS